MNKQNKKPTFEIVKQLLFGGVPAYLKRKSCHGKYNIITDVKFSVINGFIYCHSTCGLLLHPPTRNDKTIINFCKKRGLVSYGI